MLLRVGDHLDLVRLTAAATAALRQQVTARVDDRVLLRHAFLLDANLLLHGLQHLLLGDMLLLLLMLLNLTR